jgi:hypothetical protein
LESQKSARNLRMAAHRWDCSKAQFVELGFSKVCMA